MRLWTESELKILHNSKNIIPEIKGRSRNAVRDKMVQLGLLKTNKRWTASELALIKNGKIEIKGRTKVAVRLKRKKMGLSKNPRWNKEEIDLLKKNGKVSGRSRNGVRKKLVELGLKQKRKERPDWTEYNLKKLKELCELGNSAKDIANMGIFNCSQNAIQKKMCRLGLAKKIKSFKRFPEEIKNKCKKFLLENWEGKTPDELAHAWNVENHSFQTNTRRIIDYLTSLKIKIPYGEVYRIKVLRKKEQEIILSNKNSPNDILDKIRRERIKIMCDRIEKNRDMWTGLPSLVDASHDEND